MIHDSKEDGVETRGDGTFIKLRRPVVTLCLERMLIFNLVYKGCHRCGGVRSTSSERDVKFTPRRRNHEKAEVNWGAGKFEMKVFWSMMEI